MISKKPEKISKLEEFLTQVHREKGLKKTSSHKKSLSLSRKKASQPIMYDSNILIAPSGGSGYEGMLKSTSSALEKSK